MVDFFKKLKHKKSGLKLCPKCTSPNIHLLSNLDGWLLPKKYVCTNCDYAGVLVKEVNVDNYKQSDQEDQKTR